MLDQVVDQLAGTLKQDGGRLAARHRQIGSDGAGQDDTPAFARVAGEPVQRGGQAAPVQHRGLSSNCSVRSSAMASRISATPASSCCSASACASLSAVDRDTPPGQPPAVTDQQDRPPIGARKQSRQLRDCRGADEQNLAVTDLVRIVDGAHENRASLSPPIRALQRTQRRGQDWVADHGDDKVIAKGCLGPLDEASKVVQIGDLEPLLQIVVGPARAWDHGQANGEQQAQTQQEDNTTRPGCHTIRFRQNSQPTVAVITRPGPIRPRAKSVSSLAG